MSNSEKKAKAVGVLIGYVLGLAIAILIIWLFNIEPVEEYGWFSGLFHGSWAPINWIRSMMFDGVYVIAPFHTGAYIVFYWISFLMCLLTCYIGIALGTIRSIRDLMD